MAFLLSAKGLSLSLSLNQQLTCRHVIENEAVLVFIGGTVSWMCMVLSLIGVFYQSLSVLIKLNIGRVWSPGWWISSLVWISFQFPTASLISQTSRLAPTETVTK